MLLDINPLINALRIEPQGNTTPQCRNEIETQEANSSNDLAPIEPDVPPLLHQSESRRSESRRAASIRKNTSGTTFLFEPVIEELIGLSIYKAISKKGQIRFN